jgi:hypothetical protein
VVTVSSKTFVILVLRNRWVALDSHARSASGHHSSSSSLAVGGVIGCRLADTLGEIWTRGKGDAAYSIDSRGGAWVLVNGPTLSVATGIGNSVQACNNQAPIEFSWPFLTYREHACMARANASLANEARKWYALTEHPVTQSSWGHFLHGPCRAGLTSCTMVAVSAIAAFIEAPVQTSKGLMELGSMFVRRLCQRSAWRMDNFIRRVLMPIAGSDVLPHLARPDEIVANLHALGPDAADMASVFVTRGFQELVGPDEGFMAILERIDNDIVERGVMGTGAYVVTVSCKTFAILTFRGRWLALDSHARSAPGAGSSSLAATGRIGIRLAQTLG